MAKQEDLDKAYMNCARAVAALSRAERKKVGAILVSAGGHGIIAEGFNGSPAGFDNTCEDKILGNHKIQFLSEDTKGPTHECVKCLKTWNNYYEQITILRDCKVNILLTTKPEVLHAESNAIAKVAKSTNSSDGSTLYVTCSPCFECSKQIIQAGIKRVVYLEEYRQSEGLAMLKKGKIEVVQLCLS